MNTEQAKTAAKSMTELSESGKDLANTIKQTGQEAAAPKKLWQEKNKSKLIKIGMAVFFFPEPTPVCEIIGAGIMAAGAIQQGIKKQAIYAENIPKELHRTLKELRDARNFRI